MKLYLDLLEKFPHWTLRDISAAPLAQLMAVFGPRPEPLTLEEAINRDRAAKGLPPVTMQRLRPKR